MKDPITFQSRVYEWVRDAFGFESAFDKKIRTHRFVEEAIELAQATDCPKEEVLRIVEYVYGRPKGDVFQEIGGVLITLNALAAATRQETHWSGEAELERIRHILGHSPDFFRNRSANKPDFTKG
jgi:hypothetical protein